MSTLRLNGVALTLNGVDVFLNGADAGGVQPSDLVTGNPVVGLLTLSQAHGLSLVVLATNPPVIGTPTDRKSVV